VSSIKGKKRLNVAHKRGRVKGKRRAEKGKSFIGRQDVEQKIKRQLLRIQLVGRRERSERSTNALTVKRLAGGKDGTPQPPFPRISSGTPDWGIKRKERKHKGS